MNLPKRNSQMLTLLSISAIAYILLSLVPVSMRVVILCGQLSVFQLLNTNLWLSMIWSPTGLVVDWILMIIAMMAPLLSLQVTHVQNNSERRYRFEATLLFLVSYIFCWLLVGFILVPLAISAKALAPNNLELFLVIGFAVIWSASPWAQSARNQCHQLEKIRIDGGSAVLDCLRQGIVTGFSCVRTCWPWMIVPLMVQGFWHLGAMILVAVFLLLDRTTPPKSPRWQIPPLWNLVTGFKAT